jgi:zinc protease
MRRDSTFVAFALFAFPLTMGGCSASRLVAPLRAPAPPAVDEAFRGVAPPLAAVTEVTDAPPRATTLPNGLKVFLIERHGYPVVAATLTIDRGAVDIDDPGSVRTADTAGFFERGGDLAVARREAAEGPKLGAAWRGGIGSDSAFESMHARSDGFEEALSLLAARISTPLSAAEYARVAEEWQRANPGTWVAPGGAQRRILFGDRHPYGFAVPGAAPITQAEAQYTHDRLFQPAHATLIVVGDVTPEKLDAALGRTLGDWQPRGNPVPKNMISPPALEGPRLSILRHRGATQERASVFARGPVPSSDDFVPYEIVGELLGTSSQLFASLRDPSGAAYASSAELYPYRTATWLEVTGSYEVDHLVSGLQEVLRSIGRLRDGTFSDAELATARESAVARWRTTLATAEGTAGAYASAVDLRLGVDFVRDYPARVAKISRDDVMRAARAYLAPEALHVVVSGEDRWLDLSPLRMGEPVLFKAKED